jgi:hypothetical protein
MMHSPGHTDYQMALFTTIDGCSVAFTGDAFFNYDKVDLQHNLIYRNDVKVGDYLRSIRNIQQMRPRMIAPGHGEPFLVTDKMVEDFAARVSRQDEIFRTLIADPVTDMGLDPAWVQIYPYQATATAGEPCKLEIRARNHRPDSVTLQVSLCLPPGWTNSPAIDEFTVPPYASASGTMEVTIPRSVYRQNERRAIAADVVADGVHLGQITEAVVDLCSPTNLRVTL